MGWTDYNDSATRIPAIFHRKSATLLAFPAMIKLRFTLSPVVNRENEGAVWPRHIAIAQIDSGLRREDSKEGAPTPN
jgi:hypothetical protein